MAGIPPIASQNNPTVNPTKSPVLLHTLALCAGVVVAIAFQQVDDTPNTETGTQSDDQSLKHFNSRIKDSDSPLLLSCVPAENLRI